MSEPFSTVARDFPLHKAVFDNDIRHVKKLCDVIQLSSKDLHGNTPLHLAIMRGHKKCMQILLNRGASVTIKNNLGWNPLAEAISYGDREMIRASLIQLRLESLQDMKTHVGTFTEILRTLHDFYAELNFAFTSWVPFLTHVLPSDTCKIYKKGPCMRVDSAIYNITDKGFDGSSFTLIINVSVAKENRLFLLDNKRKLYQRICVDQYPNAINLEEEINAYMSNDLISLKVNSSSMEWCKKQTGWMHKKREKTAAVGPFLAKFYDVNGVILELKKRREHLSKEQLKRNKDIFKYFASHQESAGNASGVKMTNDLCLLAPPPKSNVTWQDYLKSTADNPPALARPIVLKCQTREFKGTFAMCEDFPLTTEQLIEILQMCVPFKHLQKLKSFIQLKMPKGFPVMFEVPLLPVASARGEFTKFVLNQHFDEDIFQVPDGYKESQLIFPPSK